MLGIMEPSPARSPFFNQVWAPLHDISESFSIPKKVNDLGYQASKELLSMNVLFKYIMYILSGLCAAVRLFPAAPRHSSCAGAVQDGLWKRRRYTSISPVTGRLLTNQTGRFVSGRGNTPLTEEGRKVAYAVGLGLSGRQV